MDGKQISCYCFAEKRSKKQHGTVQKTVRTRGDRLMQETVLQEPLDPENQLVWSQVLFKGQTSRTSYISNTKVLFLFRPFDKSPTLRLANVSNY